MLKNVNSVHILIIKALFGSVAIAKYVQCIYETSQNHFGFCGY